MFSCSLNFYTTHSRLLAIHTVFSPSALALSSLVSPIHASIHPSMLHVSSPRETYSVCLVYSSQTPFDMHAIAKNRTTQNRAQYICGLKRFSIVADSQLTGCVLSFNILLLDFYERVLFPFHYRKQHVRIRKINIFV